MTETRLRTDWQRPNVRKRTIRKRIDYELTEEQAKRFSPDDLIVASFYATSPGNWIQLSKVYLHLMSADEAILLCHLISHAIKCKREFEWFFCKMQQIKAELNITSSKQTRVIKKLREVGFIETKDSKTTPSTRMIRIRWSYLALRIAEFQRTRMEWDDELDES